jgi:hypothetical protein
MLRLFLLFLVLVLINSNVTFGKNYYVNNISGKDNQEGTSESTAWKTILKLNSRSFSAGDTIFFKRGCTWRETLTVPSSGSILRNIVFSSYGTGSKPRILGSVVVQSWISQGGNVWKSSVSVSKDPSRGNFVADVFFINKKDSVLWGKHKTSKADLRADCDWTWSSNFVYIYSGSDPNLFYSGVEVPQRHQCIDLHNREFIHIKGIDLYFSFGSGISYDRSLDMMNLKGLIIENSEIAYIGSKDIQSGYGTEIAYSNMIFRRDTIHDCGRRGISLDIYGSGFTVKNVLVEKCVFYSGFHTTGVDLSVGKDFYTAGYDSVIIRQNLFFDKPSAVSTSNQIFLQNYDYSGGGASVKNVFIYSNIFKYPSYSSIMAEGIQSCFIYNNTFYNHNITKAGNVSHIWIDANNSNIKIINNIFYSDLNNDSRGNGVGLVSLTDASKLTVDHNLFYRPNKTLGLIYYKSKFNSSQWDAVRQTLGWEANGPLPSDPLFKDPVKNDFTLKKGSGAIGSGIEVNIAVEDYLGKKYKIRRSLGAFEF